MNDEEEEKREQRLGNILGEEIQTDRQADSETERVSKGWKDLRTFREKNRLICGICSQTETDRNRQKREERLRKIRRGKIQTNRQLNSQTD